MKKRLLFLGLLLMTASMTYARTVVSKNVRLVFLWDVTYSMHGGHMTSQSNVGHVTIAGEPAKIQFYNKKYDIYDKVVEALVTSIEEQDEFVEIVVIPFNKQKLDCWTEKGTPEGKARLIEKIRNYRNLEQTQTSIARALKYARDEVFKADMPNTLVLLTDGDDNVTTKEFYHILENWCDFSEERNICSYYFILSDVVLRNEKLVKDLTEKYCFEVVPDLGPINTIITKSSITILPTEMTIEQEQFGNQLALQVNTANMHDGETVPVRFYVDENPYFELDQTVNVTSETKEIVLKPSYKYTKSQLLQKLPTRNPFTSTVYFSVVDGEAELQTNMCELTFLNRELKKVTITIQ